SRMLRPRSNNAIDECSGAGSSPPTVRVRNPCGSRSMASVRRPLSPSAAARLSAVVVLPVPPLWLQMVITIIGGSSRVEAIRVTGLSIYDDPPADTCGAETRCRTSGALQPAAMHPRTPLVLASASPRRRQLLQQIG